MIGDPDDPTTDDVLAALSQVGQQDVDASPERLDALEARIMEKIGHDRRPLAAVVGPAVIDAAVATRRRWPVRLVAVAAALLTFAVAFGVLSNDDDGLVIAAADAVVVMLPDGERVPGRAGTELPEGTDVEVAGFVDVDGRRYGPGRYRVADGQLVGEADSATGLVEPDVPAPTRSDDVSTSSPTSTPTANPTSTAPSEPPLAERTTVPDVASPRPATTVLPTRPATTTTTTTPIRPTTTTMVTRPTTTTPTRPTTTPPTTVAPSTSVAVRPAPPQSTAVPQTATTTTTTTTSTVPSSTTAPARSPAAVPAGPPVRVDR